MVSYNQFQHGITQKLQTFVVFADAFFVFINITSVRQRRNQQLDVIKFKAQIFPSKILIRFGLHPTHLTDSPVLFFS